MKEVLNSILKYAKYVIKNQEGFASITHGGTLPDSADKSDFYGLIDNGTVTEIVNADIAAGAAIVDTKLAQITTANKVATSAITDGALDVAAITCDSVSSAGDINIAANGGIEFAEGTAVSTAAGSGALYVKDGGTVPDLYYRTESDGDEVRITNNGNLATTGSVLQVVNAQTATEAHGASPNCPDDDTKPTWAELYNFSGLDTTIQAGNGSNLLKFDITLNLGLNGGTRTFVGLFKDGSGTDECIVGWQIKQGSNDEATAYTYTWYTTAGDTSSHTYNISVGQVGGTSQVHLNEQYASSGSGTDQFGGALISSVTITEISA